VIEGVFSVTRSVRSDWGARPLLIRPSLIGLKQIGYAKDQRSERNSNLKKKTRLIEIGGSLGSQIRQDGQRSERTEEPKN